MAFQIRCQVQEVATRTRGRIISNTAQVLLLLVIVAFDGIAALSAISETSTAADVRVAPQRHASKSIPLHLVYLMIPEHNDVLHGAGTFPLRDILVDFVNKNTTLLPQYNVSIATYMTGYNIDYNIARTIRLFTKYIANDWMFSSSNNQSSDVVISNALVSSTCNCNANRTHSQKVASNFDMPRPAPLFLGPEYSGEARVLGQLGPMYNLVEIAGGVVAADLSDRTKYPNFFRTIMSGSAFVGLPRALATYLNYTNVALLPRDDAYAEQMQRVDFDLASHSFNVLFRIKFQISPTNNDTVDMMLDSIRVYDARILFVWSTQGDEDRIFCRTLDRWARLADGNSSFSSEKFLVVFLATFEEPAWLAPTAKPTLPTCKHSHLSSMLNGSLLAMIPLWSLPTDKLEFGITNAELISQTEALGRTRYHHPTGELAPLLPRTVDAIWLSFLALDALDRRLHTETPPRSLVDFTFQSTDIATMLVQETMKIRFHGTGGEFGFDTNGDVTGQIYIEQYQPGGQVGNASSSSEYVRVLRYDTENAQVVKLNAPMIFGTKSGQPPPDKRPPAPPETSSSALLIIILMVCLGVLLLGSSCVIGFLLYRRQLALRMAKPAWQVNYNQLVVFEKARSSFGMSVLSMDTHKMSIVTGYYGKLAKLNDVPIIMQPLPTIAPPLVVNNNSYKLLTAIRDTITHDNVVKFIGYSCTPPPTLKQYFLWEGCEKGSLKELIETGTLFNLDTILEFAIMLDIARGMMFVHKSFLHVHGALSAEACMIDKRFSVKVANYADQPLAALFGLQSLDEYAATGRASGFNDENALYLAPEALRENAANPHTNAKPTQPGDVYAYAITMHVLLSRSPPYESSSLSREQIMDLIRNSNLKKPVRPSLEALPQTANKKLILLLEQCWAEFPSERPTFVDIVRRLYDISGIKAGTSVTDQLLQRLERYASDMESLVRERTHELEGEKRRSDALLNAMLPPDIANELKSNGHVQPESYDCVTIYFSDIVGFTTISSTSSPIEVVNFLNALYTMFDARIDLFDAYKVETIGDAYMVVSGLPRRNGNQHAAEIAKLALALLVDIKSFVIPHRPDEKLQLRIGLHTGPCVAGVVGTKMPRYCLFGDTVNTASRMESNGQPSKIHISQALQEALKKLGTFVTEERGTLEVKGKGTMLTYWLLGNTD